MLLPPKTKIDKYDDMELDEPLPKTMAVKTSVIEEKQENFSDMKTVMKNSNHYWINNRWRPMMGWMYMIVCIFDFIIFPIGFTAVQFWEVEAANDAFRQWNPLTLQGAGLFHMAMGAVLGITAWSRGKEKIEGKD